MTSTRARSGTTAKGLAALVSVALLAVFLVAGPGRAGPTDPGDLPIPLPDLELASKAVVAALDFTGDTEAEMTSAEVVFGRAHGKAGNPPLLRVVLRDYRGTFLRQFNEWDPRWVFAESPSGGEGVEVLPQATGRFVIPFESDLKTMDVINLRASQPVGTFDLGPAIRTFCVDHPTDPDCEAADLEISAGIIDPPPLVVIGQPETMTLRMLVTNHGPDAPMDVKLDVTTTTGPGLSVTPPAATLNEPALGLNETRTRDQAYTVACLAPGLHNVTFTAKIDALKPAVSDPDPSNNERQVSLDIDCAVPVTINIKPGGDPNSINRQGKTNIPVAVLTTAAGEYANPLTFDATTIDPLSARFGPPDLVSTGGGAEESHSTGHVEDAFELDERTKDGDLDMVLHFAPAASGFSLADAEGCMKGKFNGGGGTIFTFFGCGPVHIVQ